ncbi:hypothetical protein HK405_015122 [Cladochytrium tenue]|nr:hypothetical protein HK405_015122 [Cladochytrium tenue]
MTVVPWSSNSAFEKVLADPVFRPCEVIKNIAAHRTILAFSSSTTSNAGSSYGCAARSARTTASSCTSATTTSTRCSAASSNTAACPTTGRDTSLPRKLHCSLWSLWSTTPSALTLAGWGDGGDVAVDGSSLTEHRVREHLFEGAVGSALVAEC